jgi:putative transposase
MVVRIGGKRMYLWRAVDHEGEVLDMLVQSRRDSRAALRLMRKLLKKYSVVREEPMRTVPVICDSRDAGASSNALAAAPRQLTIMADTRIAAESQQTLMRPLKYRFRPRSFTVSSA